LCFFYLEGIVWIRLDLARSVRRKSGLKTQNIAGGALLPGPGVDDPDPANEFACFQPVEVAVQRCPTDFAIMGQPRL
jgi:hypothetical protein